MRREGCAREEVRLPSHPSTIYRGKGRGGRPRVSPRGRRPGRLDLPRENPRETCPPSQAGGGLPPKPGGGAPPPQVTWERVWGAHHPLVGWFAPPLWPMRPSNTCRGSQTPFSHAGHSLVPPEHIRTPRPFVQYIDLHRRTIPELLMASGFTSGTPNYLR